MQKGNRVPGAYLAYAILYSLAVWAGQRINNLCRLRAAFSSIPTAPTNHPTDRYALSKSARGQKGANNRNDPVRVKIFSDRSDKRIQGLCVALSCCCSAC